MLDSLVQIGHLFEKYQIYHGDIRPSNILLTSEGFVKLADHGILHVDQTNYFKVLTSGEKCYLSPSQMASLKERDLKPQHDFWKSDVFSLGITLLEIATLCEPGLCYDWTAYKVNYKMIDDLLIFARSKYS